MSIEDGTTLAKDLPATVELEVAFDWSNVDKSTMTSTAELRDASSARIAWSEGTSLLSTESGRVVLPLTAFLVTVTGTYTVLLYVDGGCVWRSSIVITDAQQG